MQIKLEPLATADPDRVLDEIKQRGICVLPAFLSPADVEAIAAEGRTIARDEPAFARVRSDPNAAPGSFLANLVPARLSRHRGWGSVPSFDKIKATPLIKQAADGYLGSGWGTSNFIYHQTRGPSRAELFKLHFDVSGYAKCLKVYLYLNDNDQTNGAFRYVPYSHRLARRALPLIMKDGIDDEEHSIKTLLQAIEQMDLKEPELQACYHLLQKLEAEPALSYDYVVSGKAGTVVLFDTIGIHGGGQVYSGDRYIARYHFVDSAYVFRYLPDQLPPVKRLASHVLRKLGAWKPPPGKTTPAGTRPQARP